MPESDARSVRLVCKGSKVRTTISPRGHCGFSFFLTSLLFNPYRTYFSTPTVLTLLPLPYLLFDPYLTYFSTPTLLTFLPLPYFSTPTHPPFKNIVNRSLVEFTFSPVSRDAPLSHLKDLQRTLFCPVGQRTATRDCP